MQSITSPIDETSYLLQQWARWARCNHGMSKLKYPNQTTFQRLRGSSLPEAMIPEPVALEVDYSVARLYDLDPESGSVLVQYFLQGQSLVRIARREKMDRRVARNRLDAAVAWVAGRLDREEY